MARFLDDLLRRAAPTLESALEGMDAALRASSAAVRRASGREEDLDDATSDLANRLLRTALRTAPTPSGLAEAGREALKAMAESLPEDALRRPWTLPLELPLSWATLATQEGLRALATAQAVPVERMGDFLAFVTEIFSDLHVYFTLAYQDELERLRGRLEHHPDDARTRRELGRTLLKCGLFDEAARELRRAAEPPGGIAKARYEAQVASYKSGDYAAATADGIACLADDPDDERARYWLWLTSKKTGGYEASVPETMRLEARDGFHPSPVELVEVGSEIGLDKVAGGRGTAVFDAFGDGHLDVAIAGAHAGVSLFRNHGDGTFTDVSTGSGLDRAVYAFAIAAGDYDNDGKVDLFVTSLGFYKGWTSLFRNNGDGTFTDVAEEAGVRVWGPSFTATWVDFDGDGLLDLFIANNLGGLFDRKTPNRLFRNNGDGTFTDVTRDAGIETLAPTIGACWGDFSNNGRPDLFLSNLGRPQLYRNNGDGTFTEVGREAGVDLPAIGSVALALDVDDDGWLDVVQLTYSRPEEAIYTLRHGVGPEGGSPMRVFKNNRDGSFTDIAPELGLTGCRGTMSAAFGDFDNDGRVELLLGNGDPAMDRNEAPTLLRRDGGIFRNIAFSAGLPFAGKGHGVNMADLSGDGRLHLVVASGGLYPGDLETTTVYRPRERPGHYLNVRLVGTASNRDAIGARLVLRAGGREQHRLVSGGSNFGCLPAEQHFGLGELTEVESLEIRWPSGRRERVDRPPVDTTVRLVEGEL